uniref:Uncharacterized protein n=1 Tax=Alexandrium monilatum TaxID=311494 RepID=A0A7S4V3Z2_9DINO
MVARLEEVRDSVKQRPRPHLDEFRLKVVWTVGGRAFDALNIVHVRRFLVGRSYASAERARTTALRAGVTLQAPSVMLPPSLYLRIWPGGCDTLRTRSMSRLVLARFAASALPRSRRLSAVADLFVSFPA